VTVRLDTDGHGTRLTVTDDGVGFTPEPAGGPAPDPDDGGYGLASMRERAELIGGAVRVTSRPGGGTTVVVTVPDQQVQSIGEGSAANT
jgi:signal transduction histidine kinase